MSDSIDRHDLAAWVAERIAPIQGERDEAMQRASDWERQADEHYAALIAARSQLADTQSQLDEENIARALWESAGIAPWRQLSEGGREQYRESARRFLAALAASPVAECYVKLPTGQGYQKLPPTGEGQQ